MKYHVRKGKFGKKEQHMERKLLDYLSDIEKLAGGQNVEIKKLTLGNKSILDSDRVKDLAKKIVGYNTNIRDKKERKFYVALMYCTLILMSVEYTYIPADDPYTDLSTFIFPKSFLIPDLTVGYLGDFYNTMAWESFFNLLADDYIKIPVMERRVIFDDPEQEQEEQEDHREFVESIDMDEVYAEQAEFEEMIESSDFMSAEEAEEINRKEGERIKEFYPGYKDFIKYTLRFVELAENYFPEDLNEVMKKMATEFALAEGYSIYSDEKKYLEVMVQINRARRLLMKNTGEITK
ncbi:MAG: hypothetical protein K6F99_07355 [Lachnospiraceae bacterium]|nr:hypothetical protein [Lachnospiraceae bacterium]